MKKTLEELKNEYPNARFIICNFEGKRLYLNFESLNPKLTVDSFKVENQVVKVCLSNE